MTRFLAGALLFVALHLGLVTALGRGCVAPVDLPPMTAARAARLPGEATLLFAGDTAAIDAALPTLAERGYDWPFRATAAELRAADLAVVNHEAPISDGGERFPAWLGLGPYRAPAASAAALAHAGIDVLELANNHLNDFGAAGIADTRAHAARAGMITLGAGASEAEARRGALVRVGDVRVGLLAYCEDQLALRAYVNLFAHGRWPGVAALSERALAADIARLRQAADVVVVSLHSGDNYAPPSAATVRWSRRAIELGADLVVGHHPHVAHPVMVHRGGAILLSLGNYAFGTPGRGSLEHGLLAFVHATRAGVDRVELEPIAVQNRRVHFQPAPLGGGELERALLALRDGSRAYGAELKIEKGRALLALPARAGRDYLSVR